MGGENEEAIRWYDSGSNCDDGNNLKDAQKLAAAISANLGYCVFTAGKSGECYGRNKVLNVKLKRKTA
jgi:hypothetical protein